MEQTLKRSAYTLCFAVTVLAVAADVSIEELSTGFEGDGAPAGWEFWANNTTGSGLTARCNLSSTVSAHTGRKGARIVKDVNPTDSAVQEQTAELLGPGYAFIAGQTYKMSLWMRASCRFTGELHWAHFPNSIQSGVKTEINVDKVNKFRRFESEIFLPAYTTMFRPLVSVGAAPKGCVIDIDDVEVTVDKAVEFEVLTGVSRGLTGFARQEAPWTLAVQQPAEATARFASEDSGVGGQISGSELDIINPGPSPLSVQLQLATPVTLQPGYIYSTTAWLRASENGVQAGFSWNSGPPAFKYVKGSASIFNAQKALSTYVLPETSVEKAQNARIHFDCGGRYVPANVLLNIEDVIVIKVKSGASPSQRPSREPFMSADFENNGKDDLTFEGITTDGAKAIFNLSSSQSASSGKLGARVIVERSASDESCEDCIRLASAAWPDEQGATYTLKFDLKSSVESAPFSVHFAAGTVANGSELSEKQYNATREFRQYTAKVTTAKQAQIHIAIHMGAAARGTVIDVDNVKVEKDGGQNVPLTQAYADFEPESSQPYACVAVDSKSGSCRFDSTDDPFEGQFAAAVTVAKASPRQPWRIQLVSGLVSLSKGYTYTVTACMRANKADTRVDFSWNSGAPQYEVMAGSSNSVSVGTRWELYTFMIDATADALYQVHFDFAGAADETVVFVDHIVATLDW